MNKYENLHEKTIFDLTNDPNVIEEITSHKTKDEYVEYLKSEADVWRNAIDIYELAEITENDELQTEVERQFKDELDAYDSSFNE